MSGCHEEETWNDEEGIGAGVNCMAAIGDSIKQSNAIAAVGWSTKVSDCRPR